MLSIVCGSKQCRKKTQNYCKITKRKLPRTWYNNIRKITKLNFFSYSVAQFYKQFIGQPKSFLPNNFFFSQLLVVQRQTFCRHLGKKSKKDIQIFNRFHSIRLCGRTSMTPQRYLFLLFMFFFSVIYSFFPTHSIELYLWHFISQYFVESMRSRIYYIRCKQPI